VANACASNPVALVVPCHRVIQSNGKLAGYRWGVERKAALLRKESVHKEAARKESFPKESLRKESPRRQSLSNDSQKENSATR